MRSSTVKHTWIALLRDRDLRQDGLLYRRGELTIGQPFINAGILGTTFEGQILGETRVGDFPAIIPQIKGSAHVTGINRFFVDPSDPFPEGFLLS
jgi:proline racemase